MVKNEVIIEFSNVTIKKDFLAIYIITANLFSRKMLKKSLTLYPTYKGLYLTHINPVSYVQGIFYKTLNMMYL